MNGSPELSSAQPQEQQKIMYSRLYYFYWLKS